MTDEVERQQSALKEFVNSGRYFTEVYGMAWGDPRESPPLREVVDRFLLPYADRGSTVVEIGAGGGRWSRELVGRVRRLILVDGIPEFEIPIRYCFDCTGIEFVVSPDGRLTGLADESVDYVFTFDTFVHFGPGLFDSYIEAVGRILKPGGWLALHYARYFDSCAFNPECFRYRDDENVSRLLARYQMRVAR